MSLLNATHHAMHLGYLTKYSAPSLQCDIKLNTNRTFEKLIVPLRVCLTLPCRRNRNFCSGCELTAGCTCLTIVKSLFRSSLLTVESRMSIWLKTHVGVSHMRNNIALQPLGVAILSNSNAFALVLPKHHACSHQTAEALCCLTTEW